MKKYIGNKSIPGLYQKILNLVPRHEYLCELFAGGAAIGLMLPHAQVKHFNDLNKEALLKIPIYRGKQTTKTTLDATTLLNELPRWGKMFSLRENQMFAFADPPYLHSTRNSSKLYDHEMNDHDHVQFLKVATATPVQMMIIHPDCDLYNDHLKNWRSVQVKIRYNRKTSIEKIYMNYPESTPLHTYKYIGKDCWQRQSIKRKAQRFVDKGMPIPFPERTYIEDTLNL